jgi:hypothetical protein
MTQVERILKHMNDFGSITTMEAFTDYGITRLASRIHDITRMGITVTKENVCAKNRYGETVHFTKYRLV